MQNIILKHALANAVQFGGKANAGAVLGKVIAESPELKKDIVKLKKEIAEVVKEVNSWSLEKQQAELEKTGYVKPERVERVGLPPLPKAIKGKVIMRLAPYPSGPLHIGNAKPYILNDEYVKIYKGKLLLIIDDTIGSEKKLIVKDAYKLIPEGLRWLGIVFDKKIIYKSDRLKIYYKYAAEIIKKGKAYVCECAFDELREKRAKKIECVHRKQSIEDNLKKWAQMLKGKYKTGQATLRIKTDMSHPNPAFRDRVLFRISDREHSRIGKKYKVWPLLEFSWAIDDHLLEITHILRGKELMMESEMEKTIWDIFGWSHPVLLHSGLMMIEGVKLSKSKAQQEVARGVYTGWDDPRTWSLQSLRKRGITPEAIRKFILAFGLTEHEVRVPIDNLYAENRKIIDKIADRYFFVSEPVEITLNKLPARTAKAPMQPGKRKYRKIPVSKKIFIEKQDFVAYRNKEVRLMHLCNVLLDKKANVTGKKVKDIPKIHWVGAKNVKIKLIMPDGRKVEGLAEPEIKKVSQNKAMQFERIGFVRLDKTKPEIICFFGHK